MLFYHELRRTGVAVCTYWCCSNGNSGSWNIYGQTSDDRDRPTTTLSAPRKTPKHLARQNGIIFKKPSKNRTRYKWYHIYSSTRRLLGLLNGCWTHNLPAHQELQTLTTLHERQCSSHANRGEEG